MSRSCPFQVRHGTRDWKARELSAARRGTGRVMRDIKISSKAAQHIYKITELPLRYKVTVVIWDLMNSCQYIDILTWPNLRVSVPYDGVQAVLLDQFGVLHDGRQPYPGAVHAVQALAESGRQVLIISNSSRRAFTSNKNVPILYLAISRRQ